MKIEEELVQLSKKIFDKYRNEAVVDICCFSYINGEVMVTNYNKLTSIDEVEYLLEIYKMYFGVNSNIKAVSSLMETPLDNALKIYNQDKYEYNYVFTFAPNRYNKNDIYTDELFENLKKIPNFYASYIVPSESSLKIIEYTKKYTDAYNGKIFFSSENLDEEIYKYISCDTNEDNSPGKYPHFWNRYYDACTNKEWFDKSNDDLDNDGVHDRLEINGKCIKTFNNDGTVQYKTYSDIVNEEGEQAQKGNENLKNNLKDMGLSFERLNESEMILFKTYPYMQDSDNDGIDDVFDPNPIMEMDSCFEIIDNCNVDIFKLISDVYIDVMENPEHGLNVKYNSEKPSISESIKYELLNVALQNGGCMVSCIPGASNLFKLITSLNLDYNVTMDTMPVAADCLLAYSLNKYTIKHLPLFDTAIGGVRAQRFNYYKHMNMMMSCAENTLIHDSEMKIKTKQNASGFGINFEVDDLQSSYSKFKSAEFDWYIAIGGGQNAIVSDIKCYEKDGETNYTAKIKYYLFDVYDWQSQAEDMLYNLHKYGICRSFYEHCYFENTITWCKGARYPKYDDIWKVDISETSFKGINDLHLKDAFQKSKDIYKFSS